MTYRDWVVSFPPTKGLKGEILSIPLEIRDGMFLGEKIVAIDLRPRCWWLDWLRFLLPYFMVTFLFGRHSTDNGYRTCIRQIRVDGRDILHGQQNGILTAFFGSTALGNGLQFKAPANSEIVAVVEFLEDATWCASIFGKMVPPRLDDMPPSSPA